MPGLAFCCFCLCCAVEGANGQDKSAQPTSDPAGQTEVADSKSSLTEQEAKAIALASDTQGPVFEFAQSGSLLSAAANQKKLIKLQLFADGKVIVGGPRGVNLTESRMSRQELDQFLNFVVNKQRFYELDSTDIESRMKGKKKLDVNDGSDSIFTVNLKRGKHEVSIYTLWNAVRIFPDFEEVQRLGAIEKRCNLMISKIHLGDRGDEVLTLINTEVKKLDLGLAPFSLDEMRLATPLANGGFQVSFERRLAEDEQVTSSPLHKMHAIYFKRNASTEPKVSFFNLPKKK